MLDIVKWTTFATILWMGTLFGIFFVIPTQGILFLSILRGMAMVVSGVLEVIWFAVEKRERKSLLMLVSGLLFFTIGIWILFGEGIHIMVFLLPYLMGFRIVSYLLSRALEYTADASAAYHREKRVLTTYDQVRILVTSFVPQGEIKGVIQGVHGLWEGKINYRELGEFFASHGYIFVSHQQRAHGFAWRFMNWRKMFRSKRSVFRYGALIQDIYTVRRMIDGRYQGQSYPIYIFGYSMGGNMVANYLIRYGHVSHERAILAAPWFRLVDPRKRFRLGARQLQLSYLLNKAKGMPLRWISMAQSQPNLYMLQQVDQAGEQAIEKAHRLKTQTLILMAGKDSLVSNEAIETFAGENGEWVKVRRYEEDDHSLHWGRNRERVMRDMLAWIQGNKGR